MKLYIFYRFNVYYGIILRCFASYHIFCRRAIVFFKLMTYFRKIYDDFHMTPPPTCALSSGKLQYMGVLRRE